jgi:hypothetical protein
VAVNRALQDFRRNGWITLERRRLALLAIERLMEIAQFNQDYLHLDGGSQQIRRYFDRLGRVGA